jgi:GT2 family glycosyltransferase
MKEDIIHACASGISVIIPNYNGEKVIRFSLLSLVNQTFPKNMYEIIVVDNASIDNSLKIIEEIKRSYPSCDIKIIKLKKNFGYGRAIDIGAINAKFDLILASNNDIIFHPKYLENLYRTYCYAKRIDKKVAAAQGLHMYYPEVNCIYNAGGLFWMLSGRYRFYGMCVSREEFSKIMKWVREGKNTFSYIAFPNGAGALIEKNVFLKVGGYYRLYFSGVEEIDLGLLLHMLGFRVIFIPSAVFYHMESYTLGGRRLLQVPHKLYLVLTGMFAYIISLYDNPLWLTASTFAYMAALALMLMYSIIMRIKFLAWVIIKTLSLNIKMLDVLLRRRSRTIGMKKISNSKVLKYIKSINKYISFANILANSIRQHLLIKYKATCK